MKNLILFFSLLVLTPSFAQKDMASFIPAKPDFVLKINGASLFSKVKQSEYEKLEFYQSLVEDIKKRFEDNDEDERRYYRFVKRDEFLPSTLLIGSEFGIDNLKDAFVFSGKTDSVTYTCTLLGVESEKKFQKFVEKVVPSTDFKEETILKKGYKYFNHDGFAIAWNKEIAVFVDYLVHNSYYDYVFEETVVEEEVDDNYYENYEDRHKDIERKREEKNRRNLESALEKIFHAPKELTIANDEQYQKAVTGKHDIAFYVDASNQMKNLQTPFFGRRSGDISKYQNLFENNYSFGYLNFEENEINVEMNNHVSDQFLNETKTISESRLNKDLLKYIDGSNLIGILGVATDTEATLTLVEKTYVGMFDAMLGESAGTGMEIFFTLLDEEEIIDLIQGDMVFAFTDIREFDVTYTSYEYDDNFERIETTETKKQTMPEFVMTYGLGNKSLRDKIIKLMNQNELLIDKGNYYQFLTRSRYSASSGMEIFFAIKDDILIVSNDFELMENNLENGVPSEQRLQGDILKLAKNNNVFGYWEPINTIDKLSSEIKPNMDNYDDFVKLLKSTYGAVQLQGTKQNGQVFTTKASIETKSDSKNALLQSFEFLNEIYKMVK